MQKITAFGEACSTKTSSSGGAIAGESYAWVAAILLLQYIWYPGRDVRKQFGRRDLHYCVLRTQQCKAKNCTRRIHKKGVSKCTKHK